MAGEDSRGGERPVDDPADAAYRDALVLLARKPLTETEVRDRLGARGHANEPTQLAIERLCDAGYVDDQRLALHFISTRSCRLGHGPGRLIQQLTARGLAPEQASRAWRTAVEQGDVHPLELLRGEIRRRLVDEGRIVDRRHYGRVYNALLRAGYEADQIERELRAFPGADEVEDEFA